MNEVAYLWTSGDRETEEVVALLRESNIDFVTVPVEDLAEPELLVGRLRFRGTDEIIEFLSAQEAAQAT